MPHPTLKSYEEITVGGDINNKKIFSSKQCILTVPQEFSWLQDNLQGRLRHYFPELFWTCLTLILWTKIDSELKSNKGTRPSSIMYQKNLSLPWEVVSAL